MFTLKVFFLLGLSLIGIGCGIGSENVSSIEPLEVWSNAKEPSITLIERDSEGLIFQIENNTRQSVYFFYAPPESAPGIATLFRYSISCGEKGRNLNDSTSHIIPSLEPLEPSHLFKFRVPIKTRVEERCIVGVPYFDDIEAVRLMNDSIMDLSADEKSTIENKRKRLRIEITPNL